MLSGSKRTSSPEMIQKSSNRPLRILIIEDDADIARLLRIHIEDLNYATDIVADGKLGLDRALSGDYSLVILDLMLPGLEGLEVCKQIRTQNAHLPILMLTAKSEEMDKVLGLELGADDYLTKPFSIRELIARMKALLRRSELEKDGESHELPSLILFGELEVDTEKRRVSLRGEMIDLTAKEWELLLLFAQNPGRVYTRQELLDLVWGYQYDGYSHTVNSHINRLRAKIETDPERPSYIITKRGLGYRFMEPTTVEVATT